MEQAEAKLLDITAAVRWIVQEQEDYAATVKYDANDEDHRLIALNDFARKHGAQIALQTDDGWDTRLSNYLSRALTLGLDTPLGRQALGKYASTAVAMFAAACRVYGDPPPAGVPSGELP